MKSQREEIQEAVQAANRTLGHLQRAQECLRSAGNWGVVDMLGGGLLTSLIKRGKMSGAEAELSQARDALRQFAAELRDVRDAADISVEINDFLGFADLFFDGLIVDWLMQSRIHAAREQVAQAQARVQAVRDELQSRL